MTPHTLFASAVAAVLFAGSAHAATEYPSFSFDLGNLTVQSDTQTANAFNGAAKGVWTPAFDGDSLFIGDFWNWHGWERGETDEILATLTLDSPESKSTTVGGTFFANGDLAWDGPATIRFGDSVLSFFFDDKIVAGYSDITATYNIAPVPLPAAGFLLLAGVGALGLAGRRRRSMSAH